MSPQDVVFVGGPANLPSVSIRCIDVANALGCDSYPGIRELSQLPRPYTVYVCVKPLLSPEQLRQLATRATVVWDIIDFPPPLGIGIGHFLASTTHVREMFRHLGEISVVPHHHCNFCGVPAFPGHREPIWIGHPTWQPTIPGLHFHAYNTVGLKSWQVSAIHRRAGILLNVRRKTADYAFHARVNSGIKVINAIGFGTPSVCEREIPLIEHGNGCALFVDHENDICPAVRRLQRDTYLYESLRHACLEKAETYSLTNIADRYSQVLSSLM